MKILDALKVLPTAGEVGVEIEIEADNLPPKEMTRVFWTVAADASLRGESCEYVLRKPLLVKQLPEAFDEITVAMKTSGTKVRPTYRAGVHVHVNVQDLTPKQLVTYLTAYFMLEEVFLAYCDKSRVGNHFCLRLSDASYLMDVLAEVVEKSDLSPLKSEDLRYASLNLTSLFKYGSVEFRALESTTDFAKITAWAGALQNLKTFSQTVTSPTDLMGSASEMGFAEFAKQAFGPYYQSFKPFATEAAITTGVRNIQYAVFARSWDKINLNIFDRNTSLFS